MTPVQPRTIPLELSFPETPLMHPIGLLPGGRLMVGRLSHCDVWLENPSVSREHAIIRLDAEGATIEDCSSKHGTLVNGQRIRPAQPERLEMGTVFYCGPVPIKIDRAYDRLSTNMAQDEAGQVRSIVVGSKGGAEQLLRMLIDSVRSISSDMTEDTAGTLLLEMLVGALGQDRGLIVRWIGAAAEVQVVARVGSQIGSLSRTVLAAAQDPNRVAHLSQTADFRMAESVIGSGMREVLCARLQVRGDENLYIYLDSQRPKSAVEANMAEFVGVAARVCSLAFDGIARRKLEDVRLDYARAATVQQRLLPERSGVVQGMEWALESLPAAPPDEVVSNASGDIVGISARPDGSVLAWVGDVSGHGPGAALLMSAAQAWLHAAAGRVEAPSVTVEALNGFLYLHTEPSDFASLLVAAFQADGSVVLCDAGHGQAFRVHGGGVDEIIFEADEGGALVGAMEGVVYPAKSLRLAVGERLVITTDGVRESRNASGVEFGPERICSVLATSDGPESDVRLLLEALRQFNGGVLHDDLTILSVARKA